MNNRNNYTPEREGKSMKNKPGIVMVSVKLTSPFIIECFYLF